MESFSTSGHRASPHDQHRPRGPAGCKAASEMTELTEPIRQLDTHRKLVSRGVRRESGARLTLDAIIVPASRPAQYLDQAITLARAAQCALLILSSHRAAHAAVQQLLAERSFNDAIVVNLPDNYRHELLDFRALASIKDDLPVACSYYVTDLSTKRNVGLILARMLGWRRIFFLDDDIRDISYPDLQTTVDMLGSYHTAGMRVSNYPDNSVVCHAHRMTGGQQDVFISGAALAVACRQDMGFFPDIYNEDWLFFYDDAARGRLGGSERTVTQLYYNPFVDPRRAAWQEFGDILAEGLYALLDLGKGAEQATRDYWFDFLYARRIFLESIRRRSGTAGLEIREQLLGSVEAALKCSVAIPPELFERYIRLWRQDLHNWEHRLSRVREMRSLDAALQTLGLSRSAGGWVADVASPGAATATGEAPTVPFTVPDFYDLLAPGAGGESRTAPGWGDRGGPNGRANFLSHHGSPGAQEGRLLASARRFFRIPGRGAGM